MNQIINKAFVKRLERSPFAPSSSNPKQTEQFIPDSQIKGLYIVHRKSGIHSYQFRTKLKFEGGRPFSMTIGKLSDIELDAARQKASDLRKLIAQGINPSKRDGERELLTLEEAVNLWLNDLQKADKSVYTIIDYRNAMSHPSIKTKLKKTLLKHIKASDIDNIHRELESKRSMANKIHTAFRSLFSWAIKKDLVENNPAQKVTRYTKDKKGKVLNKRIFESFSKEQERIFEDVLEELELETKKKTGSIINPQGLAVIQLLYHLGARTGGIVNLKRSQIMLSKNKNEIELREKAHDRVLPLEGEALRILDHFYSLRLGDGEQSFWSWSTSHGGQIALRRAWTIVLGRYKSKLKAEGVKEKHPLKCPNDLRHNRASQLILLGNSIDNVAWYCGTSIKMLEGVYVNIAPQSRLEFMKLQQRTRSS